MALFLAQHGKSLPKEQDPAKGLSEAGQAETRLIADVAKGYSIPVARIVHSGKTRARQTAEIYQSVLAPPGEFGEIGGIRPLDDAAAFGDAVNPDANLLVVGHLPFMERLVSYLTAGNADIRVYKFQNSGIVCLDREGDDWFIRWTLNPNIG